MARVVCWICRSVFAIQSSMKVSYFSLSLLSKSFPFADKIKCEGDEILRGKTEVAVVIRFANLIWRGEDMMASNKNGKKLISISKNLQEISLDAKLVQGIKNPSDTNLGSPFIFGEMKMKYIYAESQQI